VTATASGVFLLAENRLLQEALARILDKKTDLPVIGGCAFSQQAMHEIATIAPGVLVLDSFTGGLHLEFLREVRRRFADLMIVLIGMEATESAFLQAVREGVLGYILKDAAALDAVTAVRAAASGEAICPPQMLQVLLRCVARQ